MICLIKLPAQNNSSSAHFFTMCQTDIVTWNKETCVKSFCHLQITRKNTPGTRIGPDFHDRTLAIKSRKNSWKSAFVKKTLKFLNFFWKACPSPSQSTKHKSKRSLGQKSFTKLGLPTTTQTPPHTTTQTFRTLLRHLGV